VVQHLLHAQPEAGLLQGRAATQVPVKLLYLADPPAYARLQHVQEVRVLYQRLEVVYTPQALADNLQHHWADGDHNHRDLAADAGNQSAP